MATTAMIEPAPSASGQSHGVDRGEGRGTSDGRDGQPDRHTVHGEALAATVVGLDQHAHRVGPGGLPGEEHRRADPFVRDDHGHPSANRSRSHDQRPVPFDQRGVPDPDRRPRLRPSVRRFS